jgi:hypothetical protein
MRRRARVAVRLLRWSPAIGFRMLALQREESAMEIAHPLSDTDGDWR